MHWILTILIAWNGRIAIDHQEYFKKEQCLTAASIMKDQYERALGTSLNVDLFTCTHKDEA